MSDDDKKKTADDPLREVRIRHKEATDACNDAYKLCADDMRFVWVPGNQWNADLSRRRAKRPKYEFNKLRPTIKQVTNDQRQNNPSIKVRAAEDSDTDTAEVMNGLIRNIEAASRADVAFDTAGFFAATGGFGVVRITTEYANDDAFEQDIVFKEVRNPYSVKFDPHAKEFDKRDCRFCFVDMSYSREEFKHRWPKAQLVSIPDTQRYGDWFTEKEVRVTEYWEKLHDTKTIHLLSDGRVVDAEQFDPIADELANPPVDPMTGQPAAEPITVRKSRQVEYDRVQMSIVSGAEVLEGPFPWAGKFIPIIPVWGDYLNLEGEDIFYGIARPARDAQTLFNYNMSIAQEQASKSPNAPFLYTPKMIQGHESAWSGLATDDAPGLPYNPDPEAPGGMPKRQDPPQFAAAFIQLAQFSADQIKAVTGIYDASLGARSNETSGKAILARQREGDVGNFDYTDNVARAKRFAGEILVDLIPKVYDTERDIRILGIDGKEKYVKLNQTVIDQQTGEEKTINDLAAGKYDVTVTTGPSYSTQRMETAEAMTQLANGNGPDAILAKYFAVKAMDFPGGEDMLKAFRGLLVKQGLLEPDEQDAPAQGPSQREQQMMQEFQQMQQLAEQKFAELQQQLQAAEAKAHTNEAALLKAEVERESLRVDWFKAQTDRLALIMSTKADAQRLELDAATAIHQARESAQTEIADEQ